MDVDDAQSIHRGVRVRSRPLRVLLSTHTPVVLVAVEAFKLTRDALRYHFTPSEMIGRHKRGFCGDCGSRVTGGQSEAGTTWIGVTASSLDDPSWFRAQHDIFVAGAQPWDLLDPGRPKHDRYAPQ